MSKSNKSSNSKNYRKKLNRNKSHRSGYNEHNVLAERASDLTLSSSESDSTNSEDDDQILESPPKFKIAMWGKQTVKWFIELSRLLCQSLFRLFHRFKPV